MATNNNRLINRVARILVLLASTLLIVLFLPREQTYTFDYTIGKPWRYGQIIADYDFPIYKTEAAIQAERDSVSRLFQPYYVIDEALGEAQVNAMQANWNEGGMGKIAAEYATHLAAMLREVYGQGIIDSEEYEAMVDSGVTAVRIVSGQTAKSRPLQALYTTRSAYLHIMEADTVHFRRDVLAQMGINDYLSVNMEADREKSQARMQDLLASISYASGMVQSGQKVIDRGDIVTARTVSILESLRREQVKRHEGGKEDLIMGAGQVVFVVTMLLILGLYLLLFRPDYFYSWRSLLLLSALAVLFPIASSLVEHGTSVSAYVIPYALVALFARVFLDARTAFVAHTVTILLSSLSVHAPYEFVVVQLLAGAVAIYSIKAMSSRSQLFRAAFIITGAMLLLMFGYDLSQGLLPKTIDPTWYVSVCINGVLLLFAYPVMYLIERVFGFTSSITLIELSNVNTPLLRQMSKEAQGTFNHSMQVANLAMEVASKVGGNVELVRTGALYHDIGKMKNPAFFTENQSGVNPHDSLSEERSAQIIIRHVFDGVEMAEKNHLPGVIRDFIATHHGRSKTKYFYINYVNKHPGEPVNEELFTYPGPNPSTLEQAILMMCDAVEAASRSLKQITDETVSDLVNRIIDSMVQEGYFRDCPITFHDIAVAKEQLISSLKTIYHTRISYPTLNSEPKVETTTEGGASLFGGYRNWNHTRRDRRTRRAQQK